MLKDACQPLRNYQEIRKIPGIRESVRDQWALCSHPFPLRCRIPAGDSGMLVFTQQNHDSETILIPAAATQSRRGNAPLFQFC